MSFDVGEFLAAELERVKASGGGVIELPDVSTGYMTHTTNVLKDMGPFPSSVHLDGRGQHVRLDLATKGEHALYLSDNGTGLVTFDRWNVSGDPSTSTNECASAICILSGAITANVTRSHFAGIKNTVAQQGIIRMGGRHTLIEACHFGGCAATGTNAGIISLFMDTHAIRRCFFHAQSTFQGVTYSKTGSSSLIYVRAHAGVADPSTGSINKPMGSSLIEQCYIEDDSVTVAQLHCCPIDEPGLDHIRTFGNVWKVPASVPSIRVQDGSVSGSLGYGKGTNRLHSSHDTFHGEGEVAFDVEQLGELVIEHATVQNGTKQIHIGADVGEVWIWRSPGIEVDCTDYSPEAIYIDGVLQ